MRTVKRCVSEREKVRVMGGGVMEGGGGDSEGGGGHPWELLSVAPVKREKLQIPVYLLMRANGWSDERVGGWMSDGE